MNITTPHAVANVPTLSHHAEEATGLPLVLSFIKRAVHVDIGVAVLLYAVFAALIYYVYAIRDVHLDIPSSVVPSLSTVVGLMCVL